MAHRAEHLAAIGDHHLRRVAFERMAERIVGSEEEPAVAAALGDLLRRADRERARVEHPLHGVRRAELAVEIGRPGRMDDEQLFLLSSDMLDRETHGGDRHVDDQVDLVDIVPAAGDTARNIGFELVVGGNDGDRLAQDLAAEIIDRHLRGSDRARPVRGRRRTGEIGEDADLHHVIGNLRLGEPVRADQQRRNAERKEASHRVLPSAPSPRRMLVAGFGFPVTRRGSECPHPRRSFWDYAARVCCWRMILSENPRLLFGIIR